jgi:hypothetical protein
MMRRIQIAAAITVVILFAALVWPTRFSYHVVSVADSLPEIIRIDRISGTPQVYRHGEWSACCDTLPMPK